MIIKKKLKNGDTVWFTVEEICEFSQVSQLFEHTGKYLCYFKFSPPNDAINGELFKDNSRKYIEFSSIKEAEDYINKQIQ